MSVVSSFAALVLCPSPSPKVESSLASVALNKGIVAFGMDSGNRATAQGVKVGSEWHPVEELGCMVKTGVAGVQTLRSDRSSVGRVSARSATFK